MDKEQFYPRSLDKKTINSARHPFELFGILNNSFYINSVKLSKDRLRMTINCSGYMKALKRKTEV